MKFIHTADIHLDSPLCRLEAYEGAPVEEVRQASRRAFENLIDLAIEESVDFVLIAGDLFDGDWKDYNTGLYFIKQAGRLSDSRIQVFIVSGNHDAAGKMTRSLPYPDNVHVLSWRKPETRIIDHLKVAVHGQSFPKVAVTDNLAIDYPDPVPGHFNIGLLHTSLTGREGHETMRRARSMICCIKGLTTGHWGMCISLRWFRRNRQLFFPVASRGATSGKPVRRDVCW